MNIIESLFFRMSTDDNHGNKYIYSTNENAPYISPTQGEITIVAQSAMLHDMTTIFEGDNWDKAEEIVKYKNVISALNDIAEKIIACGCNTIGLMDGHGAEKRDLTEICENNKFDNKTLNVVRNSLSLSNGESGYNIVNSRINKKQPKIWELTDEPDYKAWGDILYAMRRGLEVKPEEYNTLAIGMDLVKNLDPSKMVYFNLAFPERDKDGNIPTNNTFLGSCTTYEEYLNNFQFLFKPRAITLDKGDWIIVKYGKASIAPPIDPIFP